MRALILAGGKGTRLRPLTVYTPKPIVPVINRPFLLYQIEILRRAGINEIVLSLNYQPDKIRHILGDGSEFGVELSYVTEPQPMGTGGAFHYAANGSMETTIVLNGDIFTDLVIKKVIEDHASNGADATICLAEVEDPTAYGLVETKSTGEILRFSEKPKAEDLSPNQVNFINAGIYVLESKILNLIPENTFCSFEYDVFPRILEEKLKFRAHALDNAYWCDIGTTEKYLKAHLDFMAGKIKRFDLDVKQETAEIATSASVDKRSVIGADCIIKPGASIVNSVIGEGVHIDEKATIENSVIWPHTRISDSASITGAVIAKSCYIGKNTVVSEGVVLGNKTSLTDYTKI